MIDWNASAELNNCTVEWLKDRFKRFPKSAKKIVAVCDIGGEVREVTFYNYRNLCLKCASNQLDVRKANSERTKQYHKDHPERGRDHSEWLIQWYIDHPEAVEAARLGANEQWSDQEACDEMSEIKKQWFIDHPEELDIMSERMLQVHKDNPEIGRNHSKLMIEKWSDQDFHDMMVEIRLNSESVKKSHQKQVGGNDIINHHWLYDDADLSLYTMPMTRSEHTKIHRRMQLDGYVVPHINSETDDNGLWGYK